MSHCGNNLSHYWIGKFRSSVAIPARKLFFRVWIARSAAFRKCKCGGTSWKFPWYFLNALRSSSLHSLSRMWISGAWPLVWSLRKIILQLAVSSADWWVLIGFERIRLES